MFGEGWTQPIQEGFKPGPSSGASDRKVGVLAIKLNLKVGFNTLWTDGLKMYP